MMDYNPWATQWRPSEETRWTHERVGDTDTQSYDPELVSYWKECDETGDSNTQSYDPELLTQWKGYADERVFDKLCDGDMQNIKSYYLDKNLVEGERYDRICDRDTQSNKIDEEIYWCNENNEGNKRNLVEVPLYTAEASNPTPQETVAMKKLPPPFPHEFIKINLGECNFKAPMVHEIPYDVLYEKLHGHRNYVPHITESSVSEIESRFDR